MIELLKLNKELWQLFTRQEEYRPFSLDRHQRFPYRSAKQKNIIDPVVSKFLIANGLKINYPEGKKFAVCLTHDIDSVSFSKLGNIYRAVQFISQAKFKKSLQILLSCIIKKWSPWWNFNEIMNLEKKYGAKSSFYFMTSGKYKIDKLKKEIKSIANKGWEIGLHIGYHSYNNLGEIKKEKSKLESVLGKKITGCRNHYLRFSIPQSWDILQKAGFKYDTNLGYPEMVGFRNGMCHPFRPFNLESDQEINILEIPLIISEGTLFKYMSLNTEEAWRLTKQLIDTVEKYNGVITILWHNTRFYGQYRHFYEKILKYCHQKNAWLTSGQEIWKFWQEKILGE